MRIIAFSGKQGSGKTEAAKIITSCVEKLGFRPIIVKFADPIYKIMQSQCDILHLDFDKPKMRPIMQFIGEHYRNIYSTNFWVDKWEMEVRHAEMFSIDKPEAIYICDDLRYDNEASRVTSLGGKIVDVRTNDDIRRQRINVVGADHESERGLTRPINYTIYNNGTVAQLEQQVQEMVKSIYEDTN